MRRQSRCRPMPSELSGLMILVASKPRRVLINLATANGELQLRTLTRKRRGDEGNAKRSPSDFVRSAE